MTKKFNGMYDSDLYSKVKDSLLFVTEAFVASKAADRTGLNTSERCKLDQEELYYENLMYWLDRVYQKVEHNRKQGFPTE